MIITVRIMSRKQSSIMANILVSFEIVHSFLTFLIGDLLKDKEIGNILFRDTNTSFSYTLQYFKALYEYKFKNDPELLKNYKELFKTLKKCSDYRNEVAHTGIV